MTKFFTFLGKSVRELERYQKILLVIWLLVLASLPVLLVVLGEIAMLQGMILAVLLETVLVLNVLYRAWGWWTTLRIALEVTLLSGIMLAIVIRSGLPYGDLTFTEVMQPQVLRVPILVPLTWVMMLPPSWAVAKLVTRRWNGCLMRLGFVLFSAAAFTAWEFYFNPLMAHLGIQEWTPRGGFYGIPWTHFAGLILVTAVITFAISPRRLPVGMLVMIYAVTWLADFILMFVLWRLPVPALAGFLAMGGMLLWAMIASR